MKKRLERIKELAKLIEENSSSITRNEICLALDISPITLRRYITFLKDWGYEISTAGQSLKLLRQGSFDQEPLFSKGNYTSFRILMYLYNCSPCKRKRLVSSFCKNSKEVKGNMDIRTLDIHIKKLIELDYIKKHKKDNEVYYEIADSIQAADVISFDKVINIFNYLNIHKTVLPFKDEVEDILDKMSGIITNHIRRSKEAFDDTRLTYEIFPECLAAEDNESINELAKELEKYCDKDVTLQLKMKGGSEQRVYPFCIVYNKTACCWYLVCRHTKNHDGYDLIKLDNIAEYFSDGENKKLDDEQLEIERQNARREVEESFSIGLEETLDVKILFDLDSHNIMELERRISKHDGRLYAGAEDYLVFEGTVVGAMDFLAWLRRFGSSAIILESKELRDLHIKNAERALSMYMKY